jgi:pyruvate,orthophosphate dikinase
MCYFCPTNIKNYNLKYKLKKMSNTKRVYTFGNGQAEGKAEMKNLLGGKGANLAEMNLIGVPVPPGFTITTDVCNEYFETLGKDQGSSIVETRS